MIPLRRTLAAAALAAVTACVPACHRTATTGTAPQASGDGQTYGKYRLQGTYYDYTDNAKAQGNAADMLTQVAGEPHVTLVGLWAYNPPAMLSAVRSAKKEKQVKIVGFDENEQTLQGVKEGTVEGTIVQQPFEFGYQAVKHMVAMAKDPNAPLPKDVHDGILDIPYLVIKQDNVEEFRKKLGEQKDLLKKPATVNDSLKVAFVTNNSHEFWSIAEAGTRKAAAEFNVTVLFGKPKDGSVAQQQQIINDFLSDGAKAIAVSVNDPKNQVEFLNKIADKVPLITQDNDAPGSRRKFYLGTNNHAAGKAAGKLVKEANPEGGVVGIFVGSPDALNAQQRRQGVLDELAGK